MLSKKLLVEGKDDQHVIWALCELYNIDETFEVVDCEGITRLFEQIPLRFKESELNTLGVIIDADEKIEHRWSALRCILSQMGFDVPEVLPPTGLMITHQNGFKIGVWIMPNNELNGMLEDFIAFLVPDQDKLIPVVRATLNEVERQNLNKYKIGHRSKAEIHSWLAMQDDPGTPLGLAITKRYLTITDAACGNLTTWISVLFAA